jgi:hypothetical protein
MRATLLAGFCLLGGVLLLALGGPWPAWVVLFAAALVLAVRGAR